MRPLLTVLTATGLLSACQPAPLAQSNPAVPASTCALFDTEANTCFQRGNGQRICHAFVGLLPGGRPYVYPQVMHTGRGTAGNRATTIVWHLADPRFEFTRDDGPLELKQNAEFEEPGPTDDGDGAHDNKPSARKYRIKFKNTVAARHDYRISFRQGSTVHICDPRIINDSN